MVRTRRTLCRINRGYNFCDFAYTILTSDHTTHHAVHPCYLRHCYLPRCCGARGARIRVRNTLMRLYNRPLPLLWRWSEGHLNAGRRHLLVSST